ncbi:hypothetical protein AB7M33_005192 [Pseudomonas sp. Y3 TE3536]
MNTNLTDFEITPDDLYYDDYSTTSTFTHTSTRRFNRNNVVEVIEMIREIIATHDSFTRDDRYLIEWMLREKLPSGITGYNTVRAWVSDEHTTLAELLPPHFKTHLAKQ